MYNLKNFGGRLLLKPKEFKTAIDKKKKEKSVFYLPGKYDEIYYSSYGVDGKNGKDIYKTKKISERKWSKPENIGAPFNTKYDEDYPYMHPSGKIFYFCSKGHSSMGGYDVFKSVLDTATGLWSEPENLDFAINTPDD